MKQTTLFIFCLLAMAFGAARAASQVTRADYERADTILKCSDRVYSPAVRPEWIDSSHYFWYRIMRRKEISTILSMRRAGRNSVPQIRKDWRHSSPKSKRNWPNPC